MNDSGVSKTYASALLGATNVPEEVEQELGDLAQLLFKDEKVKNFFLSPTVSNEEKEKVLIKKSSRKNFGYNLKLFRGTFELRKNHSSSRNSKTIYRRAG